MTSTKELFAYAITSTVRTKVLVLLAKKPLRQSEIAKKLRKDQSNISRVLADLEKHKLSVCLTPNKKAWKLYDLTELGREVVSIIKN